MKSQSTVLVYRHEQEVDRLGRLRTVKVATHVNKSRPGRRIRESEENREKAEQQPVQTDVTGVTNSTAE